MSGKLTKEDLRRLEKRYKYPTEEELYTMKVRPKEGPGSFYREPGQEIWWVDTSGHIGLFLFSFDRKKVFNLFEDYPHELTDKEKTLFDKENPYWANFFRTRPRRKPKGN